MNKLLVLGLLIAGTAVLWLLDLIFPDQYLEKGFFTALGLTLSYLIFKVVLEDYVSERIGDPKTRFSLRKATSILFIIAIIITALAVWVQDTQALLVSYGIVAAGAAIALQDFFKNFVGGLVIILGSVYHIGDRVMIEEKLGDVVDIGPMYTTILELGEWVDGGQATGRLTLVPNGIVIGKMVNNYTKDYSFLWDEITVPVTYQSDWSKARALMLSIAEEETSPFIGQAEAEMAGALEKYFMSARAIVPAVNVLLTDNWIKLTLRHLTPVRQRRELKGRISERVLQAFEKEGIEVASQTISVVDFPGQK